MKPHSFVRNLHVAAVFLAGTIMTANAQTTPTTFTGSYSENFDEIGTAGITLPPGFTSMVIAGGNNTYEQSTPINAAGIASATVDTQALLIWNAGTAAAKSGTQSYNVGGWDTLNDRSLGTDPTGTAAQVIQLSMTNNTGGTLYGVTFGYDCKCLTNGSAGTEESELPGYCFFYSTTGTNSAANWTEVGVAGTAALVGGVPTANGLCLPNFTQGTTMSSGPVNITFATPLTNNGIMYFRWADDNNVASSPDQMLAIDDISISSYTPAGPVISVTTPSNGAVFAPGSSVLLTATASESGGTVTNVAFYQATTLLANAPSAPYNYTWAGVAAGSYALTAVATDANGFPTTSAVVNITLAFTPPTVTITSPANGSSLGAGSTILFQASTSDTSGTVTNVSYYSGSTLLGSSTTSPYNVSYPNVPVGTYSFTATVTDNNGLSATSSVVSVTVNNSSDASFTGSYTQNFDSTLAGNTSLMPSGFSSWYIAGSHSDYLAANPESPAAVASAVPGAQTLTAWNVPAAVTDSGSGLFNIGCWDGLADRALGTDPTGTAASIIQLALTNNTGASLSGVIFSYDCKCLTNGSAGTEESELPGYSFFYSLTGSTLAGDWSGVGVAGTSSDVNGVPTKNGLCLPNFTEGTTMSSGPVSITFPTPLTNNGVMYFRWCDDNNVANSPDQMLGIDNISIANINPPGPSVVFISPTNNQNYFPNTGITIQLNATDTLSSISTVGLYADGSLAYTFTSAPYILPVPAGEFPAGSYTLYAIATDAIGLMATSAVEKVTIAYVAPTVTLTNPLSGTSYPSPASIVLGASATSPDGTVTNVAFYQGTALIGNATSAPFNYTWANVTAGSYNLIALATDTHGLTATSSVVAVTVTNGYGLPVVFLTSPANNDSFAPGSNISIMANAVESDGTITNVEFFANTTDLGGATTAPYGATLSNAAIGSYALTAVAADASGNTATSSVVNVTVATVDVPPTITLTSPLNNGMVNVSAGLTISATAGSANGTVTNVAFYQNSFLITNLAAAPYTFNWNTAPSGIYTLTAVATDNSGVASTSSVVQVTANNLAEVATLQQIKTIFVIPLENHDLVQADPTGSPEQLEGNLACPYFNSLITPGNSNSVQTAWATHYFSTAISGEHPSEPNYVWSEAGTDFGVRTDNDPGNGNTYTNVQHLSSELTAAGVPWRDYQEDLQYSSSEEASASGSGVPVNPYNGTTEYNYAVKHNPMAFFTDTQNKNIYPMTNFWTDLASTNVGRYNWITPDQYNEMHSSLPSGFTYNGTAWTGDQAAIAEGDNALSIIIPRIMESQAYKDHGVIIIWTDETESTDDTNTTLPYVIISPLAKGNAYGSTLPYNHSSDLKTMDEIFGLAYQTNTIPSGWVDAQNTGYNCVNGSSATIYDLSDFFVPATNAYAPPTISLTAPASGSSFAAPADLTLTATVGSTSGTVTNVAYYAGTTKVAAASSAPFSATTANLFAGSYALTAVATDNNGYTSTSSVANITITNPPALSILQGIKTIFVIPLENHDLVQKNPTGSPEQLEGNPACPYFNSLITPGNSNAIQTAWATHYFSSAINGEHPSEPNYIWSEAGTDFGVRTDNDPGNGNTYTNVQHLSAQLTAAGILWKDYQEDLQYSSSEEVSASGSGKPVNPYNGTTDYNYAVKHNPMAFFTDTQNKNIYPMTNFWTDLAAGNLGRYNWITPDQYNEMHSSLPAGFTYNGTAWTGDQAAIAEGDNFLSIAIPQIMASQAYKDHGVIIIWTDETESTDDTNTTLPYVIISPMAKGNAYASTLPYSHSSDLKTMDEIFRLAYQTNAIPASYLDAQNTGYNDVDGRSATIYDLSDFFVSPSVTNQPPVAGPAYYSHAPNIRLYINISSLLTNVTDLAGNAITLVGAGTDGQNMLTTNGATLFNNGTYLLYTNSVTPDVNDSFEYTVSDGHGGTSVGTVFIYVNNTVVGQSKVILSLTGSNVTANFFGIPGFSYIVDRSTNLIIGEGFVPISTNTAPTNGLIQVLDDFQDLGIPIPPAPPQVFYRLRYNP